MKLSYKWLSDYLEGVAAVEEVAKKLTAAGLEVDAIEVVAGHFSGVVVGEIRAIEKHPDADKLNICKVDVGSDQLLTIVCGASNIYVGMKAPVAMIGAHLPGDFKIKKSKLRGQVSEGMMCSAKELAISEEAEGLMDLPAEAPVGHDIGDYLQLDDVSIELDLTPNRADCLSVYGVARELSALCGLPLKKPEVIEIAATSLRKMKVDVIAKEAAPVYCARVIEGIDANVRTPLWMVERLRRSGVRSISAVVDITNYVLLALGQPMHAFDADLLDGGIVVRMAQKDEKLTLLDGSDIILDGDSLVIADEKKPLALAGIMGGLNSSVTDETMNIVLESAFFDPIAIAGRSRRYGLSTDSSHRFERGVDPRLAVYAMEYATKLILDIVGGRAGEIVAVADGKAVSPEALKAIDKKIRVDFSLSRARRLLGMDIRADFALKALESLGMNVDRIADDHWQVLAPSWRFDINIEEDLIEEIGRLYGYENLPETLPIMGGMKQTASERQISLFTLKSLLVDRGYHEAINYSFTAPSWDLLFSQASGIALKNPISTDLAVMRQSMMPGLLLSFKENIHRQQTRIRLFEEGVCFAGSAKKTFEKSYLAGLAFGSVNPVNWADKRISDFYSVKSDVEALLSLTAKPYSFSVCDDVSWLHPGQSAYIHLENKTVGVIGVIHPEVMKKMQVKSKAPVVFEIDRAAISEKQLAHFSVLSKFPSVSRDLAVVVDRCIAAGELIDMIKAQGIDVLSDIAVFDIYQGDNLSADKKSVALSLTFQAKDQTLTDEVLSCWMDKIIGALSVEFDAELRA
ncbi:MAG: phenylalanine--tRNA ligase subunit beta [Francisellaceae bacterium]